MVNTCLCGFACLRNKSKSYACQICVFGTCWCLYTRQALLSAVTAGVCFVSLNVRACVYVSLCLVCGCVCVCVFVPLILPSLPPRLTDRDPARLNSALMRLHSSISQWNVYRTVYNPTDPNLPLSLSVSLSLSLTHSLCVCLSPANSPSFSCLAFISLAVYLSLLPCLSLPPSISLYTYLEPTLPSLSLSLSLSHTHPFPSLFTQVHSVSIRR